uniref:Uncharacterized protein n=1 Tax=Magallana gigas TaxID=29159 RepID=K1QPK8_MAGGI
MGKQMCVRECQSYPGRCKSVNYNRVHLSCDLNTESATDKPEAIFDREGSTYIEILTSGNSPICGNIQCSNKEKCVVTKSGSSCILQDKEVDGWTLIYRGQSGGTDSDYLSFISNGKSDETNKNVNDEYCTSITKSPLCRTNYRTSLIDRWQSLGNFKVNVSLYKNGTKVAEVVFNGTGTSQVSWFSPRDFGEIFKYGKIMEVVVRLTYFGCRYHMLNQGSFAPKNKQAPSSIFIVPQQHIVYLTRTFLRQADPLAIDNVKIF